MTRVYLAELVLEDFQDRRKTETLSLSTLADNARGKRQDRRRYRIWKFSDGSALVATGRGAHLQARVERPD